MGWASGYIERLRAGETVSFRPRGHSMSPKIDHDMLHDRFNESYWAYAGERWDPPR